MIKRVDTCRDNRIGINLFWPSRSTKREVIGPPTAAAIAKDAETKPALKYEPVLD
jgi:hypothetical protein